MTVNDNPLTFPGADSLFIPFLSPPLNSAYAPPKITYTSPPSASSIIPANRAALQIELRESNDVVP